MSTAMSPHGQTRKRALIRWTVIVAIVLGLIIEPIVMYKSLQRERDQRRTTMEQQMASGKTVKE